MATKTPGRHNTTHKRRRTGPRVGVLARWRRLYGDNPLHLLALVGCFALAGYAVSFAAATPTPLSLLAWFAGAVIGHDLVLFPLYALADRSLLLARSARRRRGTGSRRVRVAATNYIRVPVLGAGLLLVVFFPSISAQGEQAYTAASGLSMAPYLDRWLLITAALFLISATLYALQLARTTTAPDRHEAALVGADRPGPERPGPERPVLDEPDSGR